MPEPNTVDSHGFTRAHSALAVALACAVVVALLVSVPYAAGFGLIFHESCSTDRLVSNENIWTPFALVNAPYLGTTAWGATFSLIELLGPTKVVLSNGVLGKGNLSTGYFETQNWSVYSQSSTIVLGSGSNRPCTAPFDSALSKPSFDVSYDGFPLQGPGNTSNVNETTFFSPDGRPSMTFNNGYTMANTPAISTCERQSTEAVIRSSSFIVLNPLASSAAGSNVSVAIESFESFSYFFPADSGTWQIDNLSARGGPGGGWAFSYSPCS